MKRLKSVHHLVGKVAKIAFYKQFFNSEKRGTSMRWILLVSFIGLVPVANATDFSKADFEKAVAAIKKNDTNPSQGSKTADLAH